MKKDLTDLLKLKKLETPGEEYFEHFLPEFHRYQRKAILTEPSVWERFLNQITELLFVVPRPVALATVSVAMLAIVFMVVPVRQDQIAAPTFAQADKVISEPLAWENKNVENVSDHYNDPARQQPEIQAAAQPEHDLSAPRYVTGETVAPYETTIAF